MKTTSHGYNHAKSVIHALQLHDEEEVGILLGLRIEKSV